MYKKNDISGKVVDTCIKIHKLYGPGLFESVYEKIFCYEWEKTGIPFDCQKAIPVVHEDIKLEIGFRADIIIDNKERDSQNYKRTVVNFVPPYLSKPCVKY